VKLVGSSSKGRHSNKSSTGNNKPETVKASRVNNPKTAEVSKLNNNVSKVSRFSTKRKVLTAISIFGCLVILFGVSAFAVVRWEVQPFYDYFFKPTTNVLAARPSPPAALDPDNPNHNNNFTIAPPSTGDELTPDVIENLEEIRSTDKFTFLIFGIDGSGNTDVIMVAALDTIEHSLEVVNIPRDTMVNVEWPLKKVNSIQPVMRNRFRGQDDAEAKAMQATIDEFEYLLGFDVDYWVTINMRSFVSLINAIGGVYFNVPVSMNWTDPEDGYVFNVSRGPQTLNGVQALGVVRYRAGYSNADIGRIGTQGAFLKAAATQLLNNRNSINITTMADIFINHVRTNIQLNHLVWIGREMLKVNADNINFTILPGTIDNVGVQSYITILVDEWLEIVNTKISPFYDDFTAEDLSILTRGPDRRLYVTDNNWKGNANWGASSRGPGTGGWTTNDQGTTFTPRQDNTAGGDD
jgi:LCP family protein required for cell wall assembly